MNVERALLIAASVLFGLRELLLREGAGAVLPADVGDALRVVDTYVRLRTTEET